MRKILVLLIFIPFFCFSQDLFVDKDNNEYLFIGSVEGENIKLLNLAKKEIVWLDKNSLELTNTILPNKFLEEIFKSKLLFLANGDEPFWRATISKTEMSFSYQDIEVEKIPLVIDINQYPIGSSFLLMFHAKNDRNTFGLIRKVSEGLCNLDINDEQSVYEVFINYQGKIVQGCALLTD